MKKLSLDLDALKVESFGTDATDCERGTVYGAKHTVTNGCGTCGIHSCGNSCNGTCSHWHCCVRG